MLEIVTLVVDVVLVIVLGIDIALMWKNKNKKD